jgi:hypothetical protein
MTIIRAGQGSLSEAVAAIKAEAAARGEMLTNSQAKKRLWADQPKPQRGTPLIDRSSKEIRAAIDAYADGAGIEMPEFIRAKLVGIVRGYGDLTSTDLTAEEGASVRAILAGLPTLGRKR